MNSTNMQQKNGLIMIKRFLVGLLILGSFGQAGAVAHNLFWSYDPMFHRLGNTGKGYDLSMVVEHGYDVQGRRPVESDDDDLGSIKVNELQLWSADQNMLAMLKGAPAGSDAAALALNFDLDDDDGVRGHIVPTGTVKMDYSATFAARWNMRWNMSLGLFVPIYSMGLSGLAFEDQTKDVTAEDLDVRALLTNDIPANIESLTGIKAQDWSRQGVGDIVVNLSWARYFKHHRPMLKGVQLGAYAGVGLPTASRKKEDVFFDIQFGNDGAFTAPFGGHIGLDITKYLRFGINADFAYRTGTVHSNRRLGVDANQTDLLFLNKAPVYIDWGFVQRFTLSLQSRNLIGGLRVRGLYQYQHEGEDVYFVKDSAFSAAVANGAPSLDESSTHHVVGMLEVDMRDRDVSWRIKPRVGLFVKQPFKGKRSLTAQTAGFYAGFEF
jgi:hypothetical protein